MKYGADLEQHDQHREIGSRGLLHERWVAIVLTWYFYSAHADRTNPIDGLIGRDDVLGTAVMWGCATAPTGAPA
jgi:hypothetical protein